MISFFTRILIYYLKILYTFSWKWKCPGKLYFLSDENLEETAFRVNHLASIMSKEQNSSMSTSASLLDDTEKACAKHSHIERHLLRHKSVLPSRLPWPVVLLRALWAPQPQHHPSGHHQKTSSSYRYRFCGGLGVGNQTRNPSPSPRPDLGSISKNMAGLTCYKVASYV